ncbi:BLUF domain-containing protein [Bordetella holmesii]|uniref:Sensors of blue-light using FAD n=2 Tax=Bordetella holmesii TaxID=35814 RepID=A0A158M4Q7_9BORD|nr:BLUF domain-containing protein [Bordetella holmesii]AHV94529.1 sensors of blue-light using FAD family protein [Bordetella holmesii ATCC 51541]AIT26027.1 sensors of blue-light using FAD family protein [Bordetella holmesii 44057]EWM41459.1 sensors of blue-light using FAD family protein [Bordetella holmesii 41130]AMD45107.1 hypothetical protein H558_06105 [Bordetella holmesii H558]AOB37203.1 hypothetical protein BBB42_17895 [Bordetella holmesii]
MLSTLIYRSRAIGAIGPQALQELLALAKQRNASLSVTGILLFDGIHFVQLLEGSDYAVAELLMPYSAILGMTMSCF